MRRLSLRLILLALTAQFSVSIAWAQSVYWSPADGTLQQGKVNSLDLFFDSCEPQGQPELPQTPGLELRFRGSSNSRTIINGRVSSKVINSYQAVPTQGGSVVIPSFTVETSEGPVQVPAARFQVVEATVGNTGLRPGDVFMSRFQIRDETIYAGEVFLLDYYAGAKQEYQLADLSEPEWNPQGIVSSGLKETQSGGLDWQGSRYVAKAYEARAIATEPGFIELPGAKQDATVVVGRRREFLFQEPIYDSFTLESDPFTLEIKPLPENPPASFAGAVGDFELVSRVVPEQVQVGEPVTWTLELKGEGNWPVGIGVPPRSVSSRFRAIQPEVKTEFDEDNMFSGSQTEDIVLIPTAAGSFQFGPLDYTYFDPETEAYRTLSIPATTVEVQPAASGGAPASQLTQDGEPDDEYGDDASPRDLSPAGENTAQRSPRLPQDLALGTRDLLPPVASVSLLHPTLTALAAPLVLWLALAFFRSLATDPKRGRRRALRELRRIADAPPPSDYTAVQALQRQWRGAAIAYFNLPAREPTPAEVAQAAAQAKDDSFADEWRQAWLLSDRILFGAEPADPSDWHRRQAKLARSAPRPRYSLALLGRRSAWFGAVALSALAAFSLAPPVQANDARSAYNAGNFAQAERLWVEAIDQNPNVFENRYNAGLAAAQQERWGRAWGYWVGAFCLDPNNEQVAWNLRLAHSNTGAYDPVLHALLEREGLYRIVRLRSPAGWQQLSRRALWVGGVFLCLAVASRYLSPLRRFSLGLLLLGLFAGVGAYFSQWCVSKYDALGDPGTLLVVESSPLRSIPTDLSEEQLESEAPEGAVAKADKRFLGWVKISLPNGETGWVRNEGVIPLYGPITQS